MSLVTIAEVRALVRTSLDDVQLQDVIDRIEAAVTRRIGEPQNDDGSVAVTLTRRGEGTLLFLPTEISSIDSIVEDSVTLTADEYKVWPGGVIERLPEDATWGDTCVVTYKPVDDRSERKQAVIDLVRLTIERTAMQAENVAGEYSFTAPDWDAEFRKVMRRLTFTAV